LARGARESDMAGFSEFLAQLLHEGKVVFQCGRAPRDRPTERDVAILADAFATCALSVAGPPIAFDAQTACEAAELVRQASWALVDRGERPDDLRRRLRMTARPSTPPQHLSADLLLRYLPQLLRRAQGLDPTDPLGELLGELLRRWPLSGALSDIEGGPLVPTDFGGHPGLLLLYAERIAAHDRPAWRPERSSPAYDYYQLISGEALM
jgi:MoxR-vWA-beta-propeller ternary system domain bpX4